jgi:hypothetical protein
MFSSLEDVSPTCRHKLLSFCSNVSQDKFRVTNDVRVADAADFKGGFRDTASNTIRLPQPSARLRKTLAEAMYFPIGN